MHSTTGSEQSSTEILLTCSYKFLATISWRLQAPAIFQPQILMLSTRDFWQPSTMYRDINKKWNCTQDTLRTVYVYTFVNNSTVSCAALKGWLYSCTGGCQHQALSHIKSLNYTTCSLHAHSLRLFYHGMACPGFPVILNVHYPEHLFPGIFPGAPDLGVPVNRVPVPWSAYFLKRPLTDGLLTGVLSVDTVPWSTCFYACPLLPNVLPRLPVLSNVCSLEHSLKGMLPEMFIP